MIFGNLLYSNYTEVLEVSSQYFVAYLNFTAEKSISASHLFGEIMPIFNNVHTNVTNAADVNVLVQRLTMLRVYRYNVIINYSNYLNTAIVHFQDLCPEMLYIKPYDYWVKLANYTYLKGPGDLIEVELKGLTDTGPRTLHIINRGIYKYIGSIISNNFGLLVELLNNGLNPHCITHMVTNNPNYYVSDNYLLNKIEFYRMNPGYVITPEDYMADANWMFRESE